MGNEVLAMLETLLSITERFKDNMDNRELKTWRWISARTADLRENKEEDSDPFDEE